MDISQYLSLGWAVGLLIVLIWFWNSLYIIKEWERGAVLRLGRMIPEAKGAGLRHRLPVYPEFVEPLLTKPGLLSERLRAATGDDGLARRAA